MSIALGFFNGHLAEDVHSGFGVSLLTIKKITENCVSPELIQLCIAYAITKNAHFHKFYKIVISSYILSTVIML